MSKTAKIEMFLSERKKVKERELLELKNRLSIWWFQIFCFLNVACVNEEVTFYEDVMLPEYDRAISELKNGNRNLALQLMQKITESMALQNFRDYGFLVPPALKRSYEKALKMREALVE